MSFLYPQPKGRFFADLPFSLFLCHQQRHVAFSPNMPDLIIHYDYLQHSDPSLILYFHTSIVSAVNPVESQFSALRVSCPGS